MQAIPYPNLKETLYFEELDNGLKVYVLPKAGFEKKLTRPSRPITAPSITIFKSKANSRCRFRTGSPIFFGAQNVRGADRRRFFATFSAQGASANAFTSFDRTAYLFFRLRNRLRLI